MLGFLKKNKLIVTLSSLVVTLIAAATLSTLAWFTNTSDFTPSNFTSEILTSYFDSKIKNSPSTGDTTYVITTPLHYYNMVYLYNTDWDGGFDNHTYFQLGKKGLDTSDTNKANEYKFYSYDVNGKIIEGQYSNYLNMEYYSGSKALRPLGDETKPFNSHIIGNNLTVTNIHINGEGYSDIGIFGYVAANADIHNVYYEGVDIDTAGAIPHSGDSRINVGYIAGHIASENGFSDVYVNSCQIRNSQNNNKEQRNNYGYFGYCDISSLNQTGGNSYHYTLKPNAIHDYFNTVYGSSSSRDMVLRGTENNTTSDPVSAAIGHTTSPSDYYSFTGDNSSTDATRNYSLSTTGTKDGDKLYNIYYKDGTSYVPTFNPLTTITESSPDNPTEAGTFVYYDASEGKWVYYVSSPSGSVVNTAFRCFTISYKYNTTVHYLKYSGGYLGHDAGPDGNAPELSPLNSETQGDYFFVLKEDKTSRGVATISDGDGTGNGGGSYYIFNPYHNAYLTYNSSGSLTGNTSGLFTTDSSQAIKFRITGSTNANAYFTYSEDPSNTYGIIRDDPVTNPTYAIGVGKVVSGGQSIAKLSFHSPTETHIPNPSAGTFTKVTGIDDIADEDYISFWANDTNNTDSNIKSGYFGISSQKSSNNIKRTLNGIASSATSFNSADFEDLDVFRVSKNGNNFKFYSLNNQGYLASESSTSHALKIFDKAENEMSESELNQIQWTLTLPSSDLFKVRNVAHTGNYLLYYGAAKTVANDLWHINTTPDANTENKPRIYKLNSSGDGSILYTYTAVEIEYEAEGGSNFKTDVQYDVYYSGQGASSSTKNLLSFATIHSWIFASHSFVNVTPTASSGWKLVKSGYDLKLNSKYVFACADYNAVAGPLSDSGSVHYLTKIDSVFKDDGKTVVPGANAVEFTLGGAPGAYTFTASGSGLLATNEAKKLNLNGTGTTTWDLTFTNSELVFASTNKTTYGAIRYNDNNGENQRFVNYKYNDKGVIAGEPISLYRYVEEESVQELYFADEIRDTHFDATYNPEHIDLVGGAKVYSNNVVLDDGAVQNMKSISYWTDSDGSNSGIGKDFYATKYTSDAIVVKIPNNNSLDFGTMTIECDTSTQPVFIKGSDLTNKSISLSDVNCSDDDTESNSQSYKLSLNPYNIYKLSYCALDSGGRIVSSYDTAGNELKPGGLHPVAASSIRYFILVISAPLSGSVSISNIDVEFNEIIGNSGNFGKVGYRTATYGSGSGTSGNNVTSGTVDGEKIHFTYSVSSSTANVYVKVVHAGSRYDLYFYSSEACTLYVFNYDAENASVYVTSTGKSEKPYKETFNEIPISAGTPPGGWNPSYSPIITN